MRVAPLESPVGTAGSRGWSRAAAMLALAVMLSACALTRQDDYRRVADSGISYADAVPSVLETAFAEAVRADSAVLRSTREQVTATSRRASRITENTRLLRERQTQLARIAEHARLLRGYFTELRDLAAGEHDRTVATRTREIVDGLAKLQPSIAGIRLGRRSVGEVAGTVAGLAVSGARVRALDAELRTNGDAVARALTLQQAAMTVIADYTEENSRLANRSAEFDAVILPYARGGTLPDDWEQRRLRMFDQRGVTTTRAAQAAATSLREGFDALLQDRNDDPSIDALIRDVRRLEAIVERAMPR